MVFECLCCVFFFFFKQKTAYEMRISDWSSDVCSSDLRRSAAQRSERDRDIRLGAADMRAEARRLQRQLALRNRDAHDDFAETGDGAGRSDHMLDSKSGFRGGGAGDGGRRAETSGRSLADRDGVNASDRASGNPLPGLQLDHAAAVKIDEEIERSEEHTSEIQSIMRISY